MSENDPKLSRLYREASAEEPPAVLDAVILAAAQNHVEKSQRREASQRLERAQGRERSFWSRWIAPAGAIATLALGVSIALLVEREQPGTSDATATRQLPPRPQTWPPAPIAETAKPKADESATTEASAKKEAPAAAAPAQTPESIAPAQAPAPAVPEQAPDSGVPAQAPVSAAPPRAPEPVAPAPAAPAPSAEEAFQAESRAKRATAAPKAVESKSSRESNAAGDAATGGSAAGAPAAPAAAGRVAPLRQQADQRSPEAWLEEIGRLRREGRDIEAAEQLAQFRKAYPAHAVPEHLLK